MKMWQIVSRVVMSVALATSMLCAKSLLIIDTENGDLYGYDRLAAMCTKAGLKTDVAHFYNVGNLDSYDAILVCLHPTMIKSPDHPILQPIINDITQFAQTPGKLLMLGLPSLSSSEEAAENFKAFLKQLGLTEAAESEELNNYLSLNVMKNINYHTMLEDTKKHFDTKAPTFTIGISLNNPAHNNHVYITRCPLLTFNEVAENFWINPIDNGMRSHLLSMVQEKLNELATLIGPHHAHSEFGGSRSLVLSLSKDEESERDNDLQRKRNINASKIAAAWMAPDAFDGEEVLKKQIEHIANARLNLLWFNLSPELYLSVNASQPESREKQLGRIRNITRALKEKFQELGRPVPAIYLGVEITGNLRKAKVKEPMVDLFGNVYDKIPAPFDMEGFWKPEFFDVFDKFVEIWEKDVGNGLPLSGLFIDFEMYHAQNQAGSYPALADFSPTSMALYAKANPEAALLLRQAQDERAGVTLFKSGKLNDYFATLKHQAFLLGRDIRNHVRARLPQAKFGAYFPNVSADWFYTGIFAGLSTAQEPLILATFNRSIKGHEAWMQKNKIYVQHLAAILLSKFQNLESFGLIDELNQANDGIWYNRYSWMAHPYDAKAWWATESTPFDHDVVSREIGRHRAE